MPRATRLVIRTSPAPDVPRSRHRQNHHAIARMGGMSTVVYLHENARPPTAADAHNHALRPLVRYAQKKKSRPVMAAVTGNSIVTRPPCAIKFGLSAKSQAERAMARGPYSSLLQPATS